MMKDGSISADSDLRLKGEKHNARFPISNPGFSLYCVTLGKVFTLSGPQFRYL